MKKYRSHKIVEAAVIVGASAGENFVRVKGEGGSEKITVPDGFFARGFPEAGDYLVRYEPDGYLSWSPRDKFEAGYTEIA